jgi:hypothetical protein
MHDLESFMESSQERQDIPEIFDSHLEQFEGHLIQVSF